MASETDPVNHRASDADPHAELSRLRREVLELRRENARLDGRTQVLVEGPLMRYREQLLSQNWRERFFELRADGARGVELRCFRRDRRCTAGNGQLRMVMRLTAGCELAREEAGAEAGGLHCFHLKLPAGSGVEGGVLRLGATTAEEADAWIEALESACLGPESGKADCDGAPEPAPAPDAPKKLERRPSAVIQEKGGPPKMREKVDVLRPVHKEARESLLTSAAGGLPDCSLVGIMNLSVTVMVAMHFRLLIENLTKYGVLLDPVGAVSSLIAVASGAGGGSAARCVLCLLGLPGFAGACLLIERAASKGQLTAQLANALHGFVCTLCIAVPSGVIRQTQAHPAMGGVLIMAASVLFLKLSSYAHVNAELRRLHAKAAAAADGEKVASGGYPANVTGRDLFQFLAFPTLVYQLDYPRTQGIRRVWLLKRLGELLLCLAMMCIITEQFVVPILQNAQAPIKELNAPRLLERLLKLAVPNVYLWLCMFYGLFHLWLNILAEVTCFGDRLFYKEWWNATNLEDYWRLWNLPVHTWLLRHVFFPALNLGVSKGNAAILVFFVSAVFHELVVSVPCHTFRLWAFLGMMAQLPLIKVTGIIDRRLKGSQLGNIIFWLSFCIVGQPLCVLLYFAEFL